MRVSQTLDMWIYISCALTLVPGVFFFTTVRSSGTRVLVMKAPMNDLRLDIYTGIQMVSGNQIGEVVVIGN